jgi:hypothetical protein
MPHIHLGFFTAGKKYRVPGFLATSLNENIARNFMAMANQSRDEPCVLWIITVDRKCLHVSYIARTHVSTEEEFLFAPYSPFKVLRVSDARLYSLSFINMYKMVPAKMTTVTVVFGEIAQAGDVPHHSRSRSHAHASFISTNHKAAA